MNIASQQDEVYEQQDSESSDLCIKVGELLGEGSFGSVFKVYDTSHKNEILAMKIEYDTDEEEDTMLDREIKMLMDLRKKGGFPVIKYYGQESHFTYYIMTLLGSNLESVSKKCGGSFSLNTLLRIGIQMLSRIESLHNARLIHRDIKPDNFVLGYGTQQSIVHLIDFGLAKYYVNQRGEHIKQVRKKGLIGTARYASINAHNEQEQSRRDDLESICYVLIYLGLGTLPWMNLQIEQKDLKYAKILYIKKSYPIQKLIHGLPQCFGTILEAVKKLGFKEQPNYVEYRRLMQSELEKCGSKLNYFDWEQLGDKKKSHTIYVKPQLNDQNDILIKQAENKQDKNNKNIQFDKFEQFLNHNHKRLQKMTSSKKQGSNKTKKKKVLIDVVQPDSGEPGQQQDSIRLLEDTSKFFQSSAKSFKLLQPPSTPAINNSYIYSLDTSRQNNYDWSEKISSEGKPIWSIYTDKNSKEQNQFNNIMTGIIAKPKTRRRSSQKLNCFTLTYPQKNLVSASDEEVCEID